MARRGKGEGSIFKRKDGLWATFVTVGYDQQGRQKKKWAYGKTRREVAEKLSRLMAHSGSRIVQSPERVTVEEWLRRYVELRGKDKAPKTRENYRQYLNKIVPALGHVPLRRLTPLHVREFYGELVEAGLSPSVRQHAHDLMNAAMKDAVKLELLERNPLDLVERPKGGATVRPQVWTPEEVKRFLETARHHRLYAGFYLLLTCGLRIGELLALRWSDWEGERLHIRQGMAVVNNRPLISEKLKSDRSYRTLYLPQGAQEVLAVRREEQQMERELATRWQETELIFSSTVGTPTHPNNFRRTFKSLIRQAGVRKIRVHDNRHTWVTLARDAGLAVEVVAERAGHDVRMTTAVYSQITEERKRKAALELDELLGSTP